MQPTCELLGQYAELLNDFGVDSHEARLFLENHRINEEFFELAQLSRKVKLALTASIGCNAHNHSSHADNDYGG